MVIHSIEDDTDARLVQCHHHLLELLDAGSRSIRIGAIATFWHIIVLRVIAPVELWFVQTSLVDRGKVEQWLEMYSIDTQLLQIFYCLRFGEGEIFTLIFQTRCRRNGEITYMEFVDNEVGWRLYGRAHILIPSHGVGIIQINDSATVSVDAYSLGEGSRRFTLTNIKGIELTLQVAFHGSLPSLITHFFHFQRLVSLTSLSVLIKTDGNRRLASRWGIEYKHGFLLGIHHLIECLLRLQCCR